MANPGCSLTEEVVMWIQRAGAFVFCGLEFEYEFFDSDETSVAEFYIAGMSKEAKEAMLDDQFYEELCQYGQKLAGVTK
jgi:hypothetical protein